MMRLVPCALVAFAVAAPAFAQDFETEVMVAVASNPSLAAERARLLAVRQALPTAWAEALPQINADALVVAQDRTEDRFDLSIRGQPEYWIASVRVSTLLFGGGRIWASTRQARAQIASSVALYQDAVQNLALEFTQAYGQARFTRERLAAQEESLANLEEQLRFARANLREGFMTRTDVAQAEARVAQARADLARAQADVIEASEFYARVAGHPPAQLAPAPAIEGLPANLDAALMVAGDEHPALVAAAANVMAANAAVDLAAANGRMRVFLESTNTTYDSVDAEDDPIEYSQQFERNISVRAAIPLFTGGAVRARERQQRHLRNAARYELTDIQRRVDERVAVTWASRDAARARLEASRLRLEAAELASRGVRREQQFGQRSMIDVLNQEQERLSARVGVAEAQRDLMIAERALAASVGMIAEVLGLEAMEAPRRRSADRATSADPDER
jgi:outer membrane protein